MNPIDIAMLVVLALSAAIGLWRGLVFELISGVGLVAAIVLAWQFGPWLAAWLAYLFDRPGWDASALPIRSLAVVLIFLATLVVSRLVAAGVRRWISRSTPLTPIDRMAGGGFGLLRGLVLLWLAVWAGDASPWRDHGTWQSSVGVHALGGWRPQWRDEARSAWRGLPSPGAASSGAASATQPPLPSPLPSDATSAPASR